MLIVQAQTLHARGMPPAVAIRLGATMDQGHIVFTRDAPGYEQAMTMMGHLVSDPPNKVQEDAIVVAGRKLWAELHGWAWTADPETSGQWIDHFTARVPCGECKAHWRQIIGQAPLPKIEPGESVEAWRLRVFAWTVDRHNDVSQRLNELNEKKPEKDQQPPKQIFTLEEALVRWPPAAEA